MDKEYKTISQIAGPLSLWKNRTGSKATGIYHLPTEHQRGQVLDTSNDIVVSPGFEAQAPQQECGVRFTGETSNSCSKTSGKNLIRRSEPLDGDRASFRKTG